MSKKQFQKAQEKQAAVVRRGEGITRNEIRRCWGAAMFAGKQARHMQALRSVGLSTHLDKCAKLKQPGFNLGT